MAKQIVVVGDKEIVLTTPRNDVTKDTRKPGGAHFDPWMYMRKPSCDAQWNKNRILIPGNQLSPLETIAGLTHQNVSGLTLVDEAPWGTSGKSLRLNGSQVCQLNDHAAINMGSTDLTIEMFVRIDVAPSNGYGYVLLNKGGGLNVAWSSFILWAKPDGTFVFGSSYTNTRYDVGNNLTDAGAGWGSWKVGKWGHVAITRQGNVWRFFSDGKLAKSQTVAGSIFANSGRGLMIGHSRDNNWTSGPIVLPTQGLFHAIRISNVCRYTQDFAIQPISLAACV